ncbi:MAG: hypothetical protein M3Z75_08885 [Actinomycetota bacterium]|nr:hypothetical protein [Actinomycetota bacterium]
MPTPSLVGTHLAVMRLRPGAGRRKLAVMAMQADDLPIDAAVVRDLAGTQFPQWRGLPVRRVASSGTVNAIFRLGDRLAARFLLQDADPATTRRELESEAAATWRSSSPRSGRSAPGPDVRRPRRGGDLEDHDDWMRTCLRRSEGLLDVRRLTGMWAAFRELPREAPDVMSHGGLTPGNVLTAGGRLAGVPDVGCRRPRPGPHQRMEPARGRAPPGAPHRTEPAQ